MALLADYRPGYLSYLYLRSYVSDSTSIWAFPIYADSIGTGKILKKQYSKEQKTLPKSAKEKFIEIFKKMPEVLRRNLVYMPYEKRAQLLNELCCEKSGNSAGNIRKSCGDKV